MGLATRRRTRRVIVALALIAVMAGWDAWRLRDAANWNERIAAGTVPADATDVPPEARFAQAHALAASAADDAAMNRYRALQSDTPLGEAARYNSANLLMRQAMVLRDGPQPGQAIPLIELAKENYREVLRRDPGQWDARYNLERAQRLLPDAEDSDVPPAGPPEAAERAATTMRGVSQGLP